MSMYGWLWTRLSAQFPKPTRVFGTISVTTAPEPPPEAGASPSQYVYVAASPSTAALRKYSCISVGSRLCSNSASNSAFTTSTARTTRPSPLLESTGEASSFIRSLVMLATVNSVTRLRKLNTGVGRPFDSTPSHCLPTKKFSFTLTVSSSCMLSL